MGIVDNVKEIADLIKKVGDADLYRRIVTLEGEVLDLTREKRRIEYENEELRQKLQVRALMSYRKPFWYREGDEVPHCANCWEKDERAIHLTGPVSVAAGPRYDCPTCHNVFIAGER